jgi:hypothetical protein
MTTQVKSIVVVQIGGEEHVVSTEEREATWNEQVAINHIFNELADKHTKAKRKEDQVVEYVLDFLREYEAQPQKLENWLSFPTKIRLHALACNATAEEVLRKLHREGKLGHWLE